MPIPSGLKRSGSMWIRAEDAFMPTYFEATGDRFEIEHLDAALGFCREWRVALDVGAHYGSWTRHMARRFVRVVAFEPIAETFACLRLNTAGLPNVEARRAAVGSEPGLVSVGQGKMYSHPGMETITAMGGEVELVTIDSLSLDALDLLKIDVEGYELFVLQGAQDTLRRCRPVVVFEENIRGPLEHGVENGVCGAYLAALGAREVQVVNKDHIFAWD
jgi:FkbM family methyltransferase